jgi:hypothetical protein
LSFSELQQHAWCTHPFYDSQLLSKNSNIYVQWTNEIFYLKTDIAIYNLQIYISYIYSHIIHIQFLDWPIKFVYSNWSHVCNASEKHMISLYGQLLFKLVTQDMIGLALILTIAYETNNCALIWVQTFENRVLHHLLPHPLS